MVCPWCKKAGSKVVDSRLVLTESIRRRRHKCEHCERKFSTLEVTEEIYEGLLADLKIMQQENGTLRDSFRMLAKE